MAISKSIDAALVTNGSVVGNYVQTGNITAFSRTTVPQLAYAHTVTLAQAQKDTIDATNENASAVTLTGTIPAGV